MQRQYRKIGNSKNGNSFFFHQWHALSTSFDIFIVTYRVTNFLPKLIDMLLFSTEKPEFPFLVFPYFQVMPYATTWRLKLGAVATAVSFSLVVDVARRCPIPSRGVESRHPSPRRQLRIGLAPQAWALGWRLLPWVSPHRGGPARLTDEYTNCTPKYTKVKVQHTQDKQCVSCRCLIKSLTTAGLAEYVVTHL